MRPTKNPREPIHRGDELRPGRISLEHDVIRALKRQERGIGYKAGQQAPLLERHRDVIVAG
ncbi:MAG: hypothetical protein WB812_10380 [Woeseiaceae bacterium]